MTDEQIIKAFEKCTSDNKDFELICDSCPFNNNHARCDNLHTEILDLINRQKAEIERLKICNEGQRYTIRIYQIGETKSEAIKEFAERLKNKMIVTHKSTEGYCIYEFDDELIDNLVKEMTEQKG